MCKEALLGVQKISHLCNNLQKFADNLPGFRSGRWDAPAFFSGFQGCPKETVTLLTY